MYVKGEAVSVLRFPAARRKKNCINQLLTNQTEPYEEQGVNTSGSGVHSTPNTKKVRLESEYEGS